MIDGAQLWSAYEAAADSNSLATDIITSGTINVISDAVAQVTERTPLVQRQLVRKGGPDWARTGRFGVFGSADGAVSHAWFAGLDAVVGESGTLSETITKVAADQLIYTPLFCVWFLAAFVLLEGRPIASIPSVLRAEWFELFRGNAGFFLPLTGLIYGFVPRDERVLAFGAGSLVYTWILSLWNSARRETQEAVGKELCLLDVDEDCVPMPAGASTRPVLSMRIRRALVQIRRRANGRITPPKMSLRDDGNDNDGGSDSDEYAQERSQLAGRGARGSSLPMVDP